MRYDDDLARQSRNRGNYGNNLVRQFRVRGDVPAEQWGCLFGAFILPAEKMGLRIVRNVQFELEPPPVRALIRCGDVRVSKWGRLYPCFILPAQQRGLGMVRGLQFEVELPEGKAFHKDGPEFEMMHKAAWQRRLTIEVLDDWGFGNYLREKREERRISMTEMAEKLGISVAYLSYIERDRLDGRKDELIQRACVVLGLDPEEAYAAARRCYDRASLENGAPRGDDA